MRFRRPNGRPAKLTLGKFDQSDKEGGGDPILGHPLTLAAARRLAADIHHQRARGHDVVSDYDALRRRQKSENETRAASTFAGAATDFIKQHAMRKTRRWREQNRLHQAARHEEDPPMAGTGKPAGSEADGGGGIGDDK
jgi:hypothetical protein